MSTIPPNSRNSLMRTAAGGINMAIAQPTKSKVASRANSNNNNNNNTTTTTSTTPSVTTPNNASSKAKSQMHRRSRTGKCD